MNDQPIALGFGARRNLEPPMQNPNIPSMYFLPSPIHTLPSHTPTSCRRQEYARKSFIFGFFFVFCFCCLISY